MMNCMVKFICTFAVLCLLASACARQPAPVANQATPSGPTRQAASPQIKVTSTAFKDGELIPRQYTCLGINISPPLEWTPTPAAKSLAIICNDPDAPGGAFTHWLVYNLPPATMGFIENMPPEPKVGGGGMQGKNDFGDIGYGGPCPPKGMHHYLFKVYALDAELPLKPGATKDELLQAMEGHILSQGQVIGRYSR